MSALWPHTDHKLYLGQQHHTELHDGPCVHTANLTNWTAVVMSDEKCVKPYGQGFSTEGERHKCTSQKKEEIQADYTIRHIFLIKIFYIFCFIYFFLTVFFLHF